MGNKPIYLRMGLETTWLGLEPRQTHATWFQDLMKLRFLMSHCRRDKVIVKKWIYSDSERSTFHTLSLGHHRGRVVVWLVFIGWVISYVNQWEDCFICFGEGVEISRNWATTHSLVFWQCLGTVMVPQGASFSLLIEDPSKWTCPPSWTHLILIGLCCVLGLCHTFKSGALPPSLLLQNDLVLGAVLRSIHHPWFHK